MTEMTLDEVLESLWQRWTRGKADRNSPLHTPVVGTVDASGKPKQRVMVLREVNRTERRMRFHTDIRSAKVDQIGDAAPVSVIGYDPSAKIQLRLSGTARIEQDSETADKAWAASALSSRRCYLANPGPGTAVDAPMSGLTAEQELVVPSQDESEAARPAFAVLLIDVTTVEWLYLAASGHRRARFDWDGAAWRGTWLIP